MIALWDDSDGFFHYADQHEGERMNLQVGENTYMHDKHSAYRVLMLILIFIQ